MREVEFKYMTEAQIAELDKLMLSEHAGVIMAYGAECMNYYKENCNRIATTCFITGMLTAVAVTVGKKVYHKLKEEKKPTEKPGRVWEA